jgi:hypothetical protein
MKNDVAPFDETVKLVGTLREAWNEIASQPQAAPARPPQ